MSRPTIGAAAALDAYVEGAELKEWRSSRAWTRLGAG